MFNIFPYIFSTTLNAVSSNFEVIDEIVDKFVNSNFMNNLISEIDNMTSININFKEHRRAYTLECYLPGVKKENIDLEYDNNYITLKVKRNMVYTNNKNIAMAVIQSGGDIEEDYYVENASFLKMDNLSLNYNFGQICKGCSLKYLYSRRYYYN